MKANVMAQLAEARAAGVALPASLDEAVRSFHGVKPSQSVLGGASGGSGTAGGDGEAATSPSRVRGDSESSVPATVFGTINVGGLRHRHPAGGGNNDDE